MGTLRERMSFFNGFISRPDTVEERINELENMSVEITHIEKQRERRFFFVLFFALFFKQATEEIIQELWKIRNVLTCMRSQISTKYLK